MRELRGAYAPIVTPFRVDDGEVDHPWIASHVSYLRSQGANGIVACGTNGEAPSLSVAERCAVLETALAAAGDLPVVAGTGAAALPDAVSLTRHAFSVGAEAVLVMPPFFFKGQAESGVLLWFRRLIDAAVPQGGRVLLYHIPQLTATPIMPGVVRALIASHGEVIHGLKDSTGDPEQGRSWRSEFRGLSYFAGNDHMVAECCADGGAGSITAAANLCPGLVASVQRAAWEGSDSTALSASLHALRSLLDRFPLQPATKAALEILANFPPTAVRPPQIGLLSEQRIALETALRDWLSTRLAAP